MYTHFHHTGAMHDRKAIVLDGLVHLLVILLLLFLIDQVVAYH